MKPNDKKFQEMADERMSELTALLIPLLKVRHIATARHEAAGAAEMELYAQALTLQALANIARGCLPAGFDGFFTDHLKQLEPQLREAIAAMEAAAVFFGEKPEPRQ